MRAREGGRVAQAFSLPFPFLVFCLLFVLSFLPSFLIFYLFRLFYGAAQLFACFAVSNLSYSAQGQLSHTLRSYTPLALSSRPRSGHISLGGFEAAPGRGDLTMRRRRKKRESKAC